MARNGAYIPNTPSLNFPLFGCLATVVAGPSLGVDIADPVLCIDIV